MTKKLSQEQLERLDSIRAVSVAPSSFDETDNSVELVFSTGAVVRKYDWRGDKIYLESLPLEGMDLSILNAGAHVLRNHGLETWTLRDVLGSTVPGSAKVSNGEASVRVCLSPAPSDADDVMKIKAGVIRQLSYGYEKIGPYVVSTDPETGYEVRTWAKHRPHEVSFVPVPADGYTGTRSAGADGNHQETTMDQTNAPGAGATGDQPDRDAIRATARKEELDRQLGIRTTGKKLGSPEQLVEAMLADHTVTLDAARAKLVDDKAARDAADDAATHDQHVHVEDHVDDLRLKGLEEALLHRTNPKAFPLGDNGRRYRALSLAGVVREFAGARGREMTGPEAVDWYLHNDRRAIIGTGDLTNLLANVANKNFNLGQQRTVRWFEKIAAERLVRDFKAVKELKVSYAAVIPVLNEKAEYDTTTITDAGETWQLYSRADILKVTRQAIINDDARGLGQIPAEEGWRVMRTENYAVASILNANGALADGKALFHADHANLTASSGGVPSVAQIAKGRKLLRNAIDAAGGPKLSLLPMALLIPAALETDADQLLASIVPAQTANAVPSSIAKLQPIVVDDLTSEVMWYLACDPMFRPGLVFGHLEGQPTARLSTRVALDTQGVEFLIEHDFGAGIANHQSLYRNKGEA